MPTPPSIVAVETLQSPARYPYEQKALACFIAYALKTEYGMRGKFVLTEAPRGS